MKASSESMPESEKDVLREALLERIMGLFESDKTFRSEMFGEENGVARMKDERAASSLKVISMLTGFVNGIEPQQYTAISDTDLKKEILGSLEKINERLARNPQQLWLQ